jgi:hypothetical protein
VGDQEASRPAVLGVERLASELVRDPSAAVRDVFKREVCRVAAVAPRPPGRQTSSASKAAQERSRRPLECDIRSDYAR